MAIYDIFVKRKRFEGGISLGCITPFYLQPRHESTFLTWILGLLNAALLNCAYLQSLQTNSSTIVEHRLRCQYTAVVSDSYQFLTAQMWPVSTFLFLHATFDRISIPKCWMFTPYELIATCQYVPTSKGGLWYIVIRCVALSYTVIHCLTLFYIYVDFVIS